MKKNVILIMLSVAIVLGLVLVVYYYNNGYLEPETMPYSITTAEKTTTKKANSTGKKLLAELKDEDFYLYLKGDVVLLVHDGQTNEFTGWSKLIDAEAPRMHYADFDGDGENELLIEAVSYVSTSTSQNVYLLYILSPKQQADGSYHYDVVGATRDTWKQAFNESVKCEVNQLYKDKSRLQITMDDSNKSISYNEKTGISTSGFADYARALSNKYGEYYTVSEWEIGDGQFVIDKNKIGVDIAVSVKYEEEKSNTNHIAGHIHFELTLEGAQFRITPNSVYFDSADEFSVTDPRSVAKSNWSYQINNYSGSRAGTENLIKWIDAEFDLPKTGEETRISFSSMSSEMNRVSSVLITNKKIVLTAKDGYSFTLSNIYSGDYSVVMNSGAKDEYRINSTAEISKKDGLSVLTINLDKSYPREDIKTLAIKFGA